MFSIFPAPPWAIIEMDVFFLIKSNNSISKPLPVPSLSTDVIIISPTPRFSSRFTQSETSKPVYSLPLSIKAL